jgi:hypothetical protein
MHRSNIACRLLVIEIHPDGPQRLHVEDAGNSSHFIEFSPTANNVEGPSIITARASYDVFLPDYRQIRNSKLETEDVPDHYLQDQPRQHHLLVRYS